MSELSEAVLDIVAGVPTGRATTYGLVAEAVRARTGRGGARYVGAVLARGDADVPWWRVVRADGTLPPALRARAREMYRREGTPLRADGWVDLDRAVWDPVTEWDAAAAHVPAGGPDVAGVRHA